MAPSKVRRSQGKNPKEHKNAPTGHPEKSTRSHQAGSKAIEEPSVWAFFLFGSEGCWGGVWDLEELDGSCFDGVDGADDHEAVVVCEVDEDLGLCAEFLDGVDDIGFDCLVDGLVVVVVGVLVDGGADLFDDDLHALGEAWGFGGEFW